MRNLHARVTLYLELVPKGANIHLLAHPFLIERAHLHNKYYALIIRLR